MADAQREIHVTHKYESCHLYEWVMSPVWMSHVTHMNKSCDMCRTHGRCSKRNSLSHISMSHVTCMNESCHPYAWVMSHIWISHVTCAGHMADAQREIHRRSAFGTHQPPRISNLLLLSHVTYVHESCHTYEWVMSYPHETPRVSNLLLLNHVTYTHESCHTHAPVMSYPLKTPRVSKLLLLSHVTYMHESCHIHAWVMSHTCMSHVTHMHQLCHTLTNLSLICTSHGSWVVLMSAHEFCGSYD